MKSSSHSLSLAFFLCLFATFFFLSFFPGLRLFFFVPFLTLLLAKFPLPVCLWASLGVGTLIDILSFSSPPGLSALNYTLSSLALYRYRRLFSEEKILVFALYSVLYSLVSTTLYFLLYALFEMRISLHPLMLVTDFFLIPMFDGVYALVFVLAPLALFTYSFRPARVAYYKKRVQKILINLKVSLRKKFYEFRSHR